MSHVMPDNVQQASSSTATTCRCSRASRSSTRSRPRIRAHGARCPSGGAIVIDHTEALVSIDVNSARATRGRRHRGDRVQHQPRSGRRSRAPAAPARPGRPDRHRLHRHGESQRTSARSRTGCATRCSYDRARVQIGKISRFGLMELSRQRLRPSLGETAHITCPRCNGTGHIRGTESTALHDPAHHPGRGDEGQHRRRCTRRCRSTSPRSC